MEKEFKILKNGGKLISLKGMPNAEFADRFGLGCFKKLILKCFGRSNDKMADKKIKGIIFYLLNRMGNNYPKFQQFLKRIELNVL